MKNCVSLSSSTMASSTNSSYWLHLSSFYQHIISINHFLYNSIFQSIKSVRRLELIIFQIRHNNSSPFSVMAVHIRNNERFRGRQLSKGYVSDTFVFLKCLRYFFASYYYLHFSAALSKLKTAAHMELSFHYIYLLLITLTFILIIFI